MKTILSVITIAAIARAQDAEAEIEEEEDGEKWIYKSSSFGAT